MRPSACDTLMRLASGACFAGPHSPWSPPSLHRLRNGLLRFVRRVGERLPISIAGDEAGVGFLGRPWRPEAAQRSPPTPNQRTNQHANPAKQPRAGRKHGSDDMIAAAASGVGKQREGEAVRKKAAKTDMVLVRVTAPPAREGNPSGSGRAVTARVRGAA